MVVATVKRSTCRLPGTSAAKVRGCGSNSPNELLWRVSIRSPFVNALLRPGSFDPNMTTPCLSVSALGRCLAIVGACGAFCSNVFAQTAPAAPAASVAGTKGDTILLTPFQVSTDKDNGYAAGNTLSGGRADTPLKITSASISVMTREFLDDFAITDMNEAAAWTVGMNAPTGGESVKPPRALTGNCSPGRP